jgi:short-subunit dehydrogenase
MKKISSDITQKLFLVTGANRGLGLQICIKLSDLNAKILPVARDVSVLQEVLVKHKVIFDKCLRFDLLSPTFVEDIEKFKGLGVTNVIHCASPYTKSSILTSSIEEINTIFDCAKNDTIFLSFIMKEINDFGKVYAAGAIVGDQGLLFRGLFSLYKTTLKSVCEIIARESVGSKKSIHYLNLGTFVDEQDLEVSKSDGKMSTSIVAEQIVNGFSSDIVEPFQIDILGNFDIEILGEQKLITEF